MHRSPSFSHRLATLADLPAIVDIYNSTIASREVTADLEPVTVDARLAWFHEHASATRPIWVAEQDGRIVGWLSFSNFHPRAAYRHTAEVSIYVHESMRRHGLAVTCCNRRWRQRRHWACTRWSA